MIDIFVGYDPREASAYHTFCDSVLRRSSMPVRFTPLTPNLFNVDQRDGSNTFIYQRFLVPFLMGYTGHAIYADGDMVCLDDVAELWRYKPVASFAVACVKHEEYRTKAERKYLGARNENYPRKNWSSLMIYNCAHESCRALTPEAIREASGAFLHRMQWCRDADVLGLPACWNHLVGEQAARGDAKLLHYTLGTPCFPDYYRSDHAAEWRREFADSCRPVPQFFQGG